MMEEEEEEKKKQVWIESVGNYNFCDIPKS
jgi:hypothetical protein